MPKPAPEPARLDRIPNPQSPGERLSQLHNANRTTQARAQHTLTNTPAYPALAAKPASAAQRAGRTTLTSIDIEEPTPRCTSPPGRCTPTDATPS